MHMGEKCWKIYEQGRKELKKKKKKSKTLFLLEFFIFFPQDIYADVTDTDRSHYSTNSKHLLESLFRGCISKITELTEYG